MTCEKSRYDQDEAMLRLPRRPGRGLARHRDQAIRRRRVRLSLEALETRVVPATITVNTVADDAGVASLRAAISSINAGSDTNSAITAERTGVYGTDDTIQFAIAGNGVRTIALTAALPSLTSPMTIDGYSQPGASANTLAEGSNAILLIELAGSGVVDNGLAITTADSVIRGLVINGFRDDGVQINGPGATGNQVQGNFIGTNAVGDAAIRNGSGVTILGGASSNTVGGPTPDAGNVISGNVYGVWIQDVWTSGNTVAGNFIGTNAAGDSAIGNDFGVIVLYNATSNIVGGTTADAGNVISGNDIGVQIQNVGTSGNTVAGNFIGTNAAGDAAIRNGLPAWPSSVGATSNIVGGTTADAGNLIAFNTKGVVVGIDPADVGTVGNRLLGNRIFGNTAIGIDLGNNGPTPTGSTPGPSPTAARTTRCWPQQAARWSPGRSPALGYDLSPRVLRRRVQPARPGQTFLGFVEVTTDADGRGHVPRDARFEHSGRHVCDRDGDGISPPAIRRSSRRRLDPAIAVTPAILPARRSGTFRTTETASGGSGGPHTFSVTAGALAVGLTALDSTTGLLSAAPPP